MWLVTDEYEYGDWNTEEFFIHKYGVLSYCSYNTEHTRCEYGTVGEGAFLTSKI
jgi:hypothetical protein